MKLTFFVVAEARRLISREVKTTNNAWTEYTLKAELENGSDVFLKVGSKLSTPENISFLEGLKGEVFEAEVYISERESNGKRYVNYFLQTLPKIVE
ncbi:hypothetical protein R7127_24225 [Vibrio sp. 1159]|uniref:hypothetical protein n=1 Tax=Vibrio TaxID=662 RepID=UPI002269A676|nr:MULTISPECIES: hypothetical protein [Vibrio]MCX8755033.1 hypothetical protein [Vibrio parahaemolyticus]MDW2323377.1 hypothetical protein [Vibrio sp. 1159]